ncbi:unnamed protein product [Orchesella dallaii]|uniref:EB domain-containing protein n=1 Tax=Orchesella dallaii TaxID=48710 RepID=A0ABP1R8L1_9HEXA
MKFNKTWFPAVLAVMLLLIWISEINCHDDAPIPCKYPIQQVYSNAKQKCVSLVGGFCDLVENPDNNNSSELGERGISNFTECIKGATCVKKRYTRISRCVCQPSFSTSRERKCILRYGDPCDISDTNELLCDESKHLTCVNEKCRCREEYNHVYSEFYERCVGKVGAFCTRRASRGLGLDKKRHFDSDGKYEPDQVGCTYGAVCDAEISESFGNGVCVCMMNYNETDNGTCKLGYFGVGWKLEDDPNSGSWNAWHYLILLLAIEIIFLAIIEDCSFIFIFCVVGGVYKSQFDSSFLLKLKEITL